VLLALIATMALPSAALATKTYPAPKDHTSITSWSPKGSTKARFTRVNVSWVDYSDDNNVHEHSGVFYVDSKKTVLRAQASHGAALRKVSRNRFFALLRAGGKQSAFTRWYWQKVKGKRMRVLATASIGYWE